MLFLKFIFDENKDLHWIRIIEDFAVKLSKIGDIKILFILFSMIGITYLAPDQVVMGDEMVKINKINNQSNFVVDLFVFKLYYFIDFSLRLQFTRVVLWYYVDLLNVVVSGR